MKQLLQVRFLSQEHLGRWHLALWIQIDQIAVMGLRLRIKRSVRPCLVWLRSVLLFPLWVSFEIPIALWSELRHRASHRLGIRLHSWQRLLFCLALSLIGVQFVFLLVIGAHLSLWTILLCAGHGLAVQFLWKKGTRWFHQILSVRPVLYADAWEAWEQMEFPWRE